MVIEVETVLSLEHPVPVYEVLMPDGEPMCGMPEQQDYYGDRSALYHERCHEPIPWDNMEDGLIWCLAGHERPIP